MKFINKSSENYNKIKAFGKHFFFQMFNALKFIGEKHPQHQELEMQNFSFVQDCSSQFSDFAWILNEIRKFYMV